MEDKIGEVLVERGIITQKQLDQALDYQRSIGGKLGTILVKLRFVKEEQLTSLLADQQALSSVKLADIEVTKELMDLIPREIVEKHEVIPVKKEGGTLTVAMSDPTDFPTIEEIRFVSGLAIEAVLITRSEAQKAINQYFYGGGSEGAVTASSRGKASLHDITRQARGQGKPSVAPGGTIDDIDAPPGRMMKVIAAMLVEKGVIDLKELKKRAEA
jgi:type IV pilus assembly protein PilB